MYIAMALLLRLLCGLLELLLSLRVSLAILIQLVILRLDLLLPSLRVTSTTRPIAKLAKVKGTLSNIMLT